MEDYFRFLGDTTQAYQESIEAHLEEPDKRRMARALFAWVNDGSHWVPDDLFVAPTQIEIEPYRRAFRELSCTLGHGAHYEMMAKAVDAEGSPASDDAD